MGLQPCPCTSSFLGLALRLALRQQIGMALGRRVQDALERSLADALCLWRAPLVGFEFVALSRAWHG